jgi:hypothetical protein
LRSATPGKLQPAFSTAPRGSIVALPSGKEAFKLAPVAPDTGHLEDLEAETRQAWVSYSERLRELSGDEYERVESESWEDLQAELHRLESERESLT